MKKLLFSLFLVGQMSLGASELKDGLRDKLEVTVSNIALHSPLAARHLAKKYNLRNALYMAEQQGGTQAALDEHRAYMQTQGSITDNSLNQVNDWTSTAMTSLAQFQKEAHLVLAAIKVENEIKAPSQTSLSGAPNRRTPPSTNKQRIQQQIAPYYLPLD